MSGFSADWLALREPYDHAARNREVETAFAEAVPQTGARILDLASGAGSTVAALSGPLADAGKRDISWTLTDHDPGLLATALARHSGRDGSSFAGREVDLARDLETLPFAHVDAVTTSAFLDLVDEGFAERLTGVISQHRLPFLASLTYDGRTGFEPADAFDVELVDGVNRHQRTDKGFGPALGPDAAELFIEKFKAAGYRIVSGPSDWVLGPDAVSIQSELVSGWCSAAREIGVGEGALERWQKLRMEQCQAGMVTSRVGHIDFAALPKDAGSG